MSNKMLAKRCVKDDCIMTMRYRFCSLLIAIKSPVVVFNFYVIWLVESCLIGNHDAAASSDFYIFATTLNDD